MAQLHMDAFMAGALRLNRLLDELRSLDLNRRYSDNEEADLSRRLSAHAELLNPCSQPAAAQWSPPIDTTKLTSQEQNAVRQIADRHKIHEKSAATYYLAALHTLETGVAPVDDYHYFPHSLLSKPITEANISALAERLWFHERYQSFQCIFHLLDTLRSTSLTALRQRNPSGVRMLRRLTVGLLFKHTQAAPPNAQPALQFRHTVITNLLLAIESLGQEAASALSSASDDGSSWRYANAVCCRVLAARCVFIAACTVQLSVHDRGNAAYAQFVQSQPDCCGIGSEYGSYGEEVDYVRRGLDVAVKDWNSVQTPGGWTAHPGGEMGRLVETLRRVSDELWHSCQGEGNPAWEVTVWLVLALLQSVDYSQAKLDPDTGRAGTFTRQTAAIMIWERTTTADAGLDAAPGSQPCCTRFWNLLERLFLTTESLQSTAEDRTRQGHAGQDHSRYTHLLIDASGHAGQIAHPLLPLMSVYWGHSGVQGVVQLAMAMHLFSLFRFYMHDAPILAQVLPNEQLQTNPPPHRDPARVPFVSPEPLQVSVCNLGQNVAEGIRKQIVAFVRAAVNPQRRALSFLSRLVASSTVVHSELAANLDRHSPVLSLHMLCTELVRLNRTILAPPARQGGVRRHDKGLLNTRYGMVRNRLVVAAQQRSQMEQGTGQLQVIRAQDAGDRQFWQLARIYEGAAPTDYAPSAVGATVVDATHHVHQGMGRGPRADRRPVLSVRNVHLSARIMLGSVPLPLPAQGQTRDAAAPSRAPMDSGFYVLVSRPAMLAQSDLPDSLEDLLTLQAQLVRALPALACRYWCLAGEATNPYRPSLVDWPQEVDDDGADDAALQVDDLVQGQELSMHPADEGVGIGVKADGAEPFVIVRAYVRSVCQQLADDIGHLKADQVLALVPPPSRTAAASGGAGPRSQDFASQFFLDQDSLMLHDPAHEKQPDALALVQHVRTLSSIVSDFLSCLSSGPRCADGLLCVQHAAHFIAGLTDPVAPQQGPASSGTGLGLILQSGEDAAAQAGGGNSIGMPDSRLPVCLRVVGAASAQAGQGEDAVQQAVGGLLQDILTAGLAADDEQDRLRLVKYQADHAEWVNGSSYTTDNPLGEYLPMGAMAGPVGPTQEPVRPVVRKPHVPTLVSRLRLLSALCSDPVIRDHICSLKVLDTSLVDMAAAQASGMPGLMTLTNDPSASMYAGSGQGGQYVRHRNQSMDVLTLLLRLLTLQFQLPVKAAVFHALTRIATASPVHAATIRDALESCQVLKTLPKGPGYLGGSSWGIADEHATTETADKNYSCTLAFFDLLRVVHAQVPTVSLGIAMRQPGLHPHMAFALHVLTQCRNKPTHSDQRSATWKLAFAATTFLYDILRAYQVHYPAHPEAEAAVAAVSRVEAPGAPSTVLVDAPAAIPFEQRRKADDKGAYLYAFDLGESCSLPQARQKVCQILGDTDPDRLRLATVAEVNHFCGVSGAAGGRFKGWTQDGVVTWYDASSSPRCLPISSPAARCVWLLRVGTATTNQGQARAVVEVPAQTTGSTGYWAAGYVYGDPRFDFVESPLPPLLVARAGTQRQTMPSTRSVGFELMRALLQDKEPLYTLVLILVQLGCDSSAPGNGQPRGAACLEDNYTQLVDLSSPSASYALAAWARSQARSSKDSGMRLEARDSDGAPGFARGEGADKAASQAELQLCESASVAAREGMSGVPSRADSDVIWREKAMMAVLALLDQVLSHDKLFLEGYRSLRHNASPDVLLPMPELLRMKAALPYLVRAAGYSQDTRLGYLAARVLHKLAVARTADLPAGVLATALTQSRIAFDDSGMETTSQLTAAISAQISASEAGNDGSEALDERMQAVYEQQCAQEDEKLLKRIRKAALVDATALDSGGAQDEGVPETAGHNLDETLVVLPVANQGGLQALGGPGAPAERGKSIQAVLVVPRALLTVSVGHVLIPVSVMDGPCGERAVQGWASPLAVGFVDGNRQGTADPVLLTVGTRWDPVAEGSRRVLLLHTILRVLEDQGGHADYTLATMLLGMRPFTSASAPNRFGSVVPVLPSPKELRLSEEAQHVSCLTAIATNLAQELYLQCWPKAANIAVRIVQRLLSGSAGANVSAQLRNMLWSQSGPMLIQDNRLLAMAFVQADPSGHASAELAGDVDMQGVKRGSLVPSSVERLSMYRQAMGHLAETVACEIHSYATSQPLPVDRLQHLGLLLTAADAERGGLPALTRCLKELPIAAAHPGPPPVILSQAIRLLPAVLGLETLTRAVEALRLLPVDPYTSIGSGSSDPRLGPLLSLVDADIAVGIPQAQVQLYDPTLMKMLLVTLCRELYGQQGAQGNAPGALGLVPLLGDRGSMLQGSAAQPMRGLDLSMSIGGRPAAHLDARRQQQEVDAALAWVIRHNSYALSVRGVFGAVSGYCKLATALAAHVLPDPAPAVAAAPQTISSQNKAQRYLYTRLMEVLDVLCRGSVVRAGAGGDEDAPVSAPSVVLLPLVQLAAVLSYKLACQAPSVRVSDQEMYELVQRISTCLSLRHGDLISIVDCASSSEGAAAATVRSRLRILLLDTLLYAQGMQPPDDLRVAATGLSSLSTLTSTQKSPPVPARDVAECYRGALRALGDATAALTAVCAEDICTGPAAYRASAAMLLCAFLQPTVSPGGQPFTTSAGMLPSSLPVPSVEEMPISVQRLRDGVRAQFLLELQVKGWLRRVITAACEVDGAMRDQSGSKSVKRARSSASENSPGSPPPNVAGIPPAFGLTMQCLLAIAQIGPSAHSAGGTELLCSEGLLSALAGLQWPLALANSIIDELSSSLGLHGGNADILVAKALGQHASLLMPVLQLLSAVLRAAPEDMSVGSAIYGWLNKHQRLLEFAVQAALCSTLYTSCVRLMHAFVDLLGQLACVPGLLEQVSAVHQTLTPAPASQSALLASRSSTVPAGVLDLDCSKMDELVMSLFQRFALHPRAAEDAQVQAGLQPTVWLGAHTPQPTHASATSWITCMQPVGPVEEMQETTKLDFATASPVGSRTATTAFRLAGVSAGQDLFASTALYLTWRCQGNLNQTTLHANVRAQGVQLFWPTGKSLSGPLHRENSVARPAVKILVDAIEQACLAVAHASRQWGASEQALSTGVFSSGQGASYAASAANLNAVAVLPSSHAMVTQQMARKATYDLAQLVEQLLTVLLSQVACDRSLASEPFVLDGLHLLTSQDKQAAPVQLGLAVTAALDSVYDGSRDSLAVSVSMQGLGMGLAAGQTLGGSSAEGCVQAVVHTLQGICPGHAQRQGQWASTLQANGSSAMDDMQW